MLKFQRTNAVSNGNNNAKPNVAITSVTAIGDISENVNTKKSVLDTQLGLKDLPNLNQISETSSCGLQVGRLTVHNVSSTSTTQPDVAGSGDKPTKTPSWLPALWKRKRNQQAERRSFMRFFPVLVFDRKKSSPLTYETLDDPNTPVKSTEAGDADDVDSPSKQVDTSHTDRRASWRRLDPRRFRRLAQLADFSRRKWRGLRRAGNNARMRVRNVFSRLSLTKSATAVAVGGQGTPTLVLHNEAFEEEGDTSVRLSCPDLSDLANVSSSSTPSPREDEICKSIVNAETDL